MMISMKKTLLTIAGLLLVSGGLVFAQAVAGIPITKAPNADPTLPMYSNGQGGSIITYDGQKKLEGLVINRPSITNVINSNLYTNGTRNSAFLDLGGELTVERDYALHLKTYNCGTSIDKGGVPSSNKCYTNFKALKTEPIRIGYPEFISMSQVNVATTGGVLVLGKLINGDLVNPGSTVTPTAGTKLDVVGTGLALQGDPAPAYMNQGSSAGIIYPGASCANPNSPNCKKYACIENEPGTDVTKQQGNIVTCTTATAVATVSPARPVCSDGIDNDGDGTVDGADPQCFCSNGQYRQLWTSESSAPNTSGGLFWAGCSNININNLGPATGTAGNALTPTGGSGSSAVGLPSGGFTGSSSLAN